jgi:hypothetical protein
MLSDCKLVMLYKGAKNLWAAFLPAEFGTVLLVAQEPWVLWTNRGYSDQHSCGQMDVTVGFSRSERSRNKFGRHSNCSGTWMFHGEEKWIRVDQNTLPMATSVFLHISRKLLSALVAEQHGVDSHVVQTLCRRFLAASQYSAVSPYYTALLCYTILRCQDGTNSHSI